jgi:hypothetical protein
LDFRKAERQSVDFHPQSALPDNAGSRMKEETPSWIWLFLKNLTLLKGIEFKKSPVLILSGSKNRKNPLEISALDPTRKKIQKRDQNGLTDPGAGN